MQRKSKEQEKNTNTVPTAKTVTIKKEKFRWKDLNKDKIHRFLFGTKEKQGFLKQFVTYALLICIGFIYLYPLLYMISNSFMTLDDLLDTSVNWIPSSLNFNNYVQAAKSMSFWPSLFKSIVLALVPTALNIVSCSVVGYGLARFEFKGKKLILMIIIFSFIIPSQITMIPTYVLYGKINILNTIGAFILPSLLAQGINAPIFILIFYQFFKQVPKVLIEAASIDGAGYLRSFIKISVPSAAPAILTVFLFSFVWYWNESYLTQMYVSGVKSTSTWTNLVIQLKKFEANYNTFATQMSSTGSAATSLNESIKMSGTMLSILPILLMYFVLQRYFVESIDRAGITGE